VYVATLRLATNTYAGKDDEGNRKQDTEFHQLVVFGKQAEFGATIEEKREEAERLRLAAVPDDDKRAELVRKVQLLLKHSRCYDGGLTGRSNDAQGGLDKFVDAAKKRGKATPQKLRCDRMPRN
jgi:hypothetical protein